MTTPFFTPDPGRSNGDDAIFPAFPAPRGWQFGGDMWAGPAHQKETTDYLYGPAVAPQSRIAIMIRIAGAR